MPHDIDKREPQPDSGDSVRAALIRYAHGWFPYVGGPAESEPSIHWRRPDKTRTVILNEKMNIPKNVRRLLNNPGFEFTRDEAFDAVVRACAERRDAELWRPWITPAIQDLYRQLHSAGYATSFEVWTSGQLVSGVFGVRVGDAFFAESMFHKLSGSGNMAFAHLLKSVFSEGCTFCDLQIWWDYAAKYGAEELPISKFIELLKRATLPFLKENQ